MSKKLNNLLGQKIKKLEKHSNVIRSQFQDKFLIYILSGFGFVAGLAWNDFVKNFIEYLFPLQGDNLWAKFFYALFVTLILVVASIYLGRLQDKNNKEING